MSPIRTNGSDDGQTVHNRVEEAPGALSGVGVNAGVEGGRQLVLELPQLTARHRLPLLLAHLLTLDPQPLDEVALDPFHAALVEILEGAFDEPEDEAAEAAQQDQDHQAAEAPASQQPPA